MATALTIHELRGLARLHRADVEGADEQLAEIIADRGEELPALLHFSPSKLGQLREHDDPVGVLLALIDANRTKARDALRGQQREAAVRLAAVVAASAVVHLRGDVELDPRAVDALCGAWPNGAVVFGRRGGVDARRLRALLKECRSVPILMFASDAALNIQWDAGRSRGNIKLTLWPTAEDEDALVIPLLEQPAEVGEQPSQHGLQTPTLANSRPEAFNAGIELHGRSPTAQEPQRRHEDAAQGVPGASRAPRHPSRGVEPPRRLAGHHPPSRGLRSFLDALSSAVGGAR